MVAPSGELQIARPRERALVRLADLALAPLSWRSRLAGAPSPGRVSRVLLLRLERIGDLLMVLEAIADACAMWPEAEIDLAVGSWNAGLAASIPGLHAVVTADVPWLARGHDGDSWPTLLAKATAWRARRYDIVLNFEPDIRSNLLAWRTGAADRIGYWTGGGGAFLTDAAAYDPRQHVAQNARALVARAGRHAASGHIAAPSSVVESSSNGSPLRAAARLTPPEAAVQRARAVLAAAMRPLIGVHASGGRESKQWHPSRFAETAAALVAAHGGTVVLTGSAGDRVIVDAVKAALGDVPVIDTIGALDLPATAALLQQLDLLVTGDTGPMHLAAAVGTPVVALFGPSDPQRYGPAGDQHHVIRVQLPCSPCGQVRLPPERCRGHVPDCMDGISVAMVVRAAGDVITKRLDVEPER